MCQVELKTAWHAGRTSLLKFLIKSAKRQQSLIFLQCPKIVAIFLLGFVICFSFPYPSPFYDFPFRLPLSHHLHVKAKGRKGKWTEMTTTFQKTQAIKKREGERKLLIPLNRQRLRSLNDHDDNGNNNDIRVKIFRLKLKFIFYRAKQSFFAFENFMEIT